MTKEMLREYLGIVVDIEKNIYIQQRIISDMKERIDSLAIPKKFISPARPDKYPAKPQLLWQGEIPPKKNEVHFSFPVFFLIFILAELFCLLWTNFARPEGVPFISWLSQRGLQVLGTGAVIALLISIVGFCIMKKLEDANYIYNLNEYNAKQRRDRLEQEKYEKAYDQIVRPYEIALNCYNESVREDNHRVTLEAIEKAYLQAEYEQAKTQLSESENRLDQLYSQNILFPKYRNLVMVSSLYEYLCAGRCDSLEGHEGGYNILETEIRLDRIVAQLDKVLSSLEHIKNNQYTLYAAINEGNQLSRQMLSSTVNMAAQLRESQETNQQFLQSIQASISANQQITQTQSAQVATQIADLQKNSALAAYHIERTQKELSYMNRMNYLTGRNDGAFWNIPPA